MTISEWAHASTPLSASNKVRPFHERALNILYTHRTRGAGAEGVHIMGMVEAFRDLGHRVEMDCLKGCDPFDRNGDPEEALGNKTSVPKPKGGGSWARAAYRLVADHSPQFVFGLAELLYNMPLFWRLNKALRRRRPDFVYERYALGNFASAVLCKRLGIPLVVEVNDSVAVDRSRPTSFPSVKRALERRILSSADLVITVSKHFKNQLLEAFPGLDEAKVLILPNAVSKRRCLSMIDEDKANRRERLGLGSRPLLGSSGQFLPWHGLVPLVEATAALAKERDLGYLFIGDGPVKEEVLSAARARGVEDRVKFTGMIPPRLVPLYLSTLDVAVVSSSAAHASPMKLIEFMAMGIPVIAPNQSNIREVMEDGRTGKLFQPGDMAGLRRCLIEILDDRDASKQAAERAQMHVLAHLTWTGHARRVISRLEDLSVHGPVASSRP